jgi:hypothetical protein
MSGYDADDDIQFDFFDEPETVEATQRRRLPRLERGGGDRPPREPRAPGGGPPTGLVPLARLVGLIAIAIFVVVVLVFWVGSCQGKSKRDAYATYAQEVQAIAATDKKLGEEVAAALADTSLKQSNLETKFAEFAGQEQQEYTQAQEIRPPGPLRDEHARLLDAIELRAKGLAGLGDVLAQAGAKKSSSDTANQLTEQATLLSASDVVWEQLFQLPATQELKDQSITGVQMPKSKFIANSEFLSARAFTILMQRLTGAATGGTPSGLHGDSLVGVHVSPQGSDLQPSSATTIAVNADLSFVVTVENSGDFPETNVAVNLKISLASGGTPINRTERITSLQPTEQTTVTFSNFDLPPSAFGDRATITVEVAKVPGETRTDNNSASYPVFFTLS